MNAERKFYVYAYLRSRDSEYGNVGSPYYIGKGQGHRAYSKKHFAKPPSDESQIVFLGRHMTEADALQAEMLLIHLYGRIDLGTGCLRNMTDGGDGCSGRILSLEVRESISSKLTGRKNGSPSEETRRKIGAASSTSLRGRTLSAEHRRNISTGQKGRKFSTESRRKISEAQMGNQNNLGHKRTDETRRKQSEGMKAYWIQKKERLAA